MICAKVYRPDFLWFQNLNLILQIHENSGKEWSMSLMHDNIKIT